MWSDSRYLRTPVSNFLSADYTCSTFSYKFTVLTGGDWDSTWRSRISESSPVWSWSHRIRKWWWTRAPSQLSNRRKEREWEREREIEREREKSRERERERKETGGCKIIESYLTVIYSTCMFSFLYLYTGTVLCGESDFRILGSHPTWLALTLVEDDGNRIELDAVGL